MSGGWSSAKKDPVYGTAGWRKARLACLKAAGWRCQRGLPGCQGQATEANHRRGLANDPDHTDLEAICKSCHRRVTAMQGNAASKKRTTTPFVPRSKW